MSAIPPKHKPETPTGEENAGSMLAMYQAEQSDSASFPVLQAFQKYIDQERAQARKRITMITLGFSILLVFLLTLFVLIGFFLFSRANSSQDKLLDALLTRQQPQEKQVVVQPQQPALPPELTASLQQMAKVTDAIHENLSEQREDAKKLSQKTSEAISQQKEELKKRNAEMDELRKELKRMREESAQLKKSMTSIKEETRKEVLSSLEDTRDGRPMPAPRMKSKTPSAPKAPAKAQKPAAARQARPETKRPAAKPAPAKSPARNRPSAEKGKGSSPAPLVNPFPPATKAPPETTPGVKPPAAPKGMMSTMIPVSAKNTGTIPWRVMIPE